MCMAALSSTRQLHTRKSWHAFMQSKQDARCFYRTTIFHQNINIRQLTQM